MAQKRKKRVRNSHKGEIKDMMEEEEIEFFREIGKVGGEKNERRS